MKLGICYTAVIYANLHFTVAMKTWPPFRTSRNMMIDVDIIEANQTKPPEENSTQNATKKRSNSNEFWLLRDENTTENSIPISLETVSTENREVTEMSKPTTLDDPEWMKEYEMNQLLFMSRNNCNLELQINEWEERKLKIQYETLKNKIFGQCRLSLRGKNGTFLAVLVSNVHLNGKEFRVLPVEVLRVVIRRNHFDYILREYYGNDIYYPIMLTETDLVHLILVFNGTNLEGNVSSYNLDVFNYYKAENNSNIILQQDDHYNYGNSTRNIDDIFITTANP